MSYSAIHLFLLQVCQ